MALNQLDSVIKSFDRLIEQHPLEQRIDQIVAAVDRVGAQGERLLIWFFSLITLLVLGTIFGILLAVLTYKRFASLVATPRSYADKPA
jgi:hypothetical protein